MQIINYLGKFHPLAVHLPIGILSLFLLLALFIPRAQLQKSGALIRLVLLISALSATGSSVSGWLIANSGAYDTKAVTGHQVMGIALTLVNWGIWYKTVFLFECKIGVYRMTLGILAALMILTGHAGGSLTHGADFLTPPPVPVWFSPESENQRSVTWESSAFEAASVIFRQKCAGCHGKNKQKGKLRLDAKEYLLKGGKSGNPIAKDAASSLLIKRLLLPLDDEDHMPPKEKKQLSKTEIDFLVWWIDNGTDFENTLRAMNLPDSLKGILTTEKVTPVNPLIPERNVEAAHPSVVGVLNSFDLIVLPVAENTNHLSVQFVNIAPENLGKAVREVLKIEEQLIWLNLDHQHLDPETWRTVGGLSNLRKLSVKDSNLNDEGMSGLSSLSQLRHLNLVGTDVSLSGIEQIGALKNLKKLHIYQTQIASDDVENIRSLFPETDIEFGYYEVPILKSDTTVLRMEDR
ncbi:MAG: hypothetical protein MI975_00350 [Cytophagales bacterium]|nr:hypothetical protein [Cytophagales bacterium]